MYLCFPKSAFSLVTYPHSSPFIQPNPLDVGRFQNNHVGSNLLHQQENWMATNVYVSWQRSKYFLFYSMLRHFLSFHIFFCVQDYREPPIHAFIILLFCRRLFQFVQLQPLLLLIPLILLIPYYETIYSPCLHETLSRYLCTLYLYSVL